MLPTGCRRGRNTTCAVGAGARGLGSWLRRLRLAPAGGRRWRDRVCRGCRLRLWRRRRLCCRRRLAGRRVRARRWAWFGFGWLLCVKHTLKRVVDACRGRLAARPDQRDGMRRRVRALQVEFARFAAV